MTDANMVGPGNSLTFPDASRQTLMSTEEWKEFERADKSNERFSRRLIRGGRGLTVGKRQDAFENMINGEKAESYARLSSLLHLEGPRTCQESYKAVFLLI